MTMHHGWLPDACAAAPVAMTKEAVASAKASRRIRSLLHGAAANAAALLGRLADRVDPLDPGGAELELGNLAERIELRIGEQVGGRLHIGERDEHHAVRHRLVLA